MDNGSYIKLHRKMLEWEWYDHDITKLLFLHLLLIASWKENRWHGIELHPGELIRTNENLADELGKTIQQIRTAISNLKTTEEITVRFVGRIRIITIKNWGLYQNDNSKPNSKSNTFSTANPTALQQHSNSIPTAYKESKEYKNVRSMYTPHTPPTFEEVQDYCYQNGYQNTDIEAFMAYNEAQNWKMDWKKALVLWAKKDKDRGKRSGNQFANMIRHDDYDMDAIEAAMLGGYDG